MKVTMMDAVLKYAEANIPVMPLHWICEDGIFGIVHQKRYMKQ